MKRPQPLQFRPLSAYRRRGITYLTTHPHIAIANPHTKSKRQPAALRRSFFLSLLFLLSEVAVERQDLDELRTGVQRPLGDLTNVNVDVEGRVGKL